MRLFRERIYRRDEGFALVELLIVVLIIGILASIALVVFLGERRKAQDSSAKAAARNAVSQLETCFTDSETYVGCATNTPDPDGTGDVAPSGLSATGFTVTATSKSGATFEVIKSGNALTRACSGGSCDGGTW